MSTNEERVAAEIASRVRAERARHRWTLDELATRSAVSRRLLIQIEHAEANPSLATLLKLAAALGVTLTELLSQEQEARPIAVTRVQDAMTLWSTEAGSSARLLVSHGPLELWSWTLEPGDARVSEPHNAGALELVKVVKGTLTLEVADEAVQVKAGHSAWFDASYAHAYRNATTKPVAFTLVVFDSAVGRYERPVSINSTR